MALRWTGWALRLYSAVSPRYSRRASREQDMEVPIFQVKVTLAVVTPAVWRRVLVASDITLKRFSGVIKKAMGWYGGHLHAFETEDAIYETREDDDISLGFKPTLSEARARLRAVLREPGDKMKFDYDFGDGWRHQVLLEKILDPAGLIAPQVVAGANACPPEDCGGPHGYRHMRAVLADPGHPEYAELRDWIGEWFDPKAFDLARTNASLNPKLKRGWVPAR
jgi:hypothetical protein